MNAFEDIVLFLSAIPKFADAKVLLKNNNIVSISKIVFCTYSKKFLELIFSSENNEYLSLIDVDIKYFNILKKFIYERNEYDKSDETVAFMILTSYIFKVPQIQKFVSSFFKKIDPIKVFNKMKELSKDDELSLEVTNNSYNFFVKNIDTDMISENNFLQFGRESIRLLSQFLPTNNGGINQLFNKYEKEMEEMFQKLAIFKNKESIQEHIGSKSIILKSYATNECVAICGYKKWFIYIVNWFFYCRDRNVDDFVFLLDYIIEYDEICSGLVECVLEEFKENYGDLFSFEECEYFVNSLNAIKNLVKSNKCYCDYCKKYFTSLVLDDDKIEEFIDDNINDFKNNYNMEIFSSIKNYSKKSIFNNKFNEEEDDDDEVSNFDSASTFNNSIQFDSTFMRKCSIDGTTGISTVNSSISFTNTYVDDFSTVLDDKSVYTENIRKFNNCIFIVGGNNTKNYLSNYDIYLYDIYNNKCNVVNDVCVGRKGCKIEFKNENIFVFGGENKSGIMDPSIITINIENGKIRNMSDSFSCGRINHATICQDNYAYIIGGKLSDEKETIVKYDLEYEKKSLLLLEKPFEITGHSLCEYQNSIYIYGGITQKKNRNMFLFDSRSKYGLVKLKSPPFPISETSIVRNDNVITSFGGKTFSKEKSEPVIHKKILQFDPRANDWIVCELKCERSFYGGGACYIDEKFYTFGGYNSQNVPQKGIYVLDDVSWSNIANFPVPLAGFDFAFLP